MHIDELREYCIAKPAASEHFPFDDVTLVFKVKNKMFALINLERKPLALNLKCKPDYAIELREQYDAVRPGYHMNKKHWNTVVLENGFENGFPSQLVLELVNHSYELVVKSLPKKDQVGLLD